MPRGQDNRRMAVEELADLVHHRRGDHPQPPGGVGRSLITSVGDLPRPARSGGHDRLADGVDGRLGEVARHERPGRPPHCRREPGPARSLEAASPAPGRSVGATRWRAPALHAISRRAGASAERRKALLYGAVDASPRYLLPRIALVNLKDHTTPEGRLDYAEALDRLWKHFEDDLAPKHAADATGGPGPDPRPEHRRRAAGLRGRATAPALQQGGGVDERAHRSCARRESGQGPG